MPPVIRGLIGTGPAHGEQAAIFPVDMQLKDRVVRLDVPRVLAFEVCHPRKLAGANLAPKGPRGDPLKRGGEHDRADGETQRIIKMLGRLKALHEISNRCGRVIVPEIPRNAQIPTQEMKPWLRLDRHAAPMGQAFKYRQN